VKVITALFVEEVLVNVKVSMLGMVVSTVTVIDREALTWLYVFFAHA
jgi:hypothetical protein